MNGRVGREGTAVMAYGSSTDPRGAVPSENGIASDVRSANPVVKRALGILAVGAVSAAVAFLVVRATLRRPPSDPTTERIAALVEEAERLLKQLDDAKRV